MRILWVYLESGLLYDFGSGRGTSMRVPWRLWPPNLPGLFSASGAVVQGLVLLSTDEGFFSVLMTRGVAVAVAGD